MLAAQAQLLRAVLQRIQRAVGRIGRLGRGLIIALHLAPGSLQLIQRFGIGNAGIGQAVLLLEGAHRLFGEGAEAAVRAALIQPQALELLLHVAHSVAVIHALIQRVVRAVLHFFIRATILAGMAAQPQRIHGGRDQGSPGAVIMGQHAGFLRFFIITVAAHIVAQALGRAGGGDDIPPGGIAMGAVIGAGALRPALGADDLPLTLGYAGAFRQHRAIAPDVRALRQAAQRQRKQQQCAEHR